MTDSAHPLRELLDALAPELRVHALTHPVAAATPVDSYERLEFLGDAILGAAVTAHLYETFPDMPEGELSRIKAGVVSRAPCALVAREAGLGYAMADAFTEHAEHALIADLSRHERVLAALTESTIGAGFLQFGYEDVAVRVVASFTARIGHALVNRTDAKSNLQELVQRTGRSVAYEMVSSSGPDHEREFTMQVRIVDRYHDSGLVAIGTGRSKKAAEQEAARRLTELLEQVDEGSGKDASQAN